MKLKIVLIQVIQIMCLTGIAAENEIKVAPSAFLMSESIDEESSLSVNCHGLPPYKTIKCSFEQVRARKEEQKDEGKKLREKINGDQREQEKAISELKKSICSNATKSWDSMIEEQSAFSKGKKEILESGATFVKEFCSCVDKTNLPVINNHLKCLNNFFDWSHKYSEKTCIISSNSFSLEFIREGKKRWVNRGSKEGLCNINSVRTLEAIDEKYENWKYTQIKTGADDSKICNANNLNKPYVFSKKPSFETKMNCEVIKFDVF